jgi:RNA-binding protein 26
LSLLFYNVNMTPAVECPSFIDTLFTVLRTKSYLPYSAHSPPSSSFAPKPIDTGIPIPLDGLLSPPVPSPHEQGRKRSIDHDERDGRPTKGPRLSTEGQFPRFANGQNGRPDNHRPTGTWGGRVERPSSGGYREGVDMFGGAMGMAGMNGSVQMTGRRPQVYLPPDQKRGICRDYHSAFCLSFQP